VIVENLVVKSNNTIAENTYLIKLHSEKIFISAKPGQFCNIKVFEGSSPLLRRPFSISDINENEISFMYKVVGSGTEILSKKQEGDLVNVLGPLGKGFNIEDNFEHAIIIGGGIGIAPFPYLIRKLQNDKTHSVLFGVRNKNEIHDYGLSNISYSSDDGSFGLKGNVIDLLKIELKKNKEKKVKLFACGPTPMIKALQGFTKENNLFCEVSLESAMACGIGICQACVVEVDKNKPYKLICKHGPVFNINEIILD